jgi:small GTP-binding protein
VVAVPMPHRTQMQLIKRRLVGKADSERIKELRVILTELPNYKNGPYADLRKWVHAQIEESRVRRKVVHRDSIAVRREGVAQIALVGPPNAGKSSLLQALSAIQIRTGDYAFTTTRPVSSVTRIHDVLVQLVEIPGLIAGAHEDRGGGRALLGVLRGADAMVLCHDGTAPIEQLKGLRDELREAGIDHRAIVAVTKLDEAENGVVKRVARATALPAVGVSVLDEASIDAFRNELWRLTGLIRVFLRRPGDAETEAIALQPPATVLDAADAIHHELAASCTGARIWGPSARFEGQRVGSAHVLHEDDLVEVSTRR